MYTTNEKFFVDATNIRTIFVDIDQGTFYLLPVFANLVLQMLLSGYDVSEIKNYFANIESVPDDYESRVDSVLKKLIKYELIVETKDSATQEFISDDDALQELHASDFAYDIVPSDDVQDLLLDDPIHDVSLEGWNPISK